MFFPEAMEQIIQSQLVSAAQQLEAQLDNEIEKLDNLAIDDLGQIRENRLKEMKKLALQKQEWKANVRILQKKYYNIQISFSLCSTKFEYWFLHHFRVMASTQNWQMKRSFSMSAKSLRMYAVISTKIPQKGAESWISI